MAHPVGNTNSAQGLGPVPTTIELQNEKVNAATNVTAAAKSRFGQTNNNSYPKSQSISQPLEDTLASLNKNLEAWSTGLKFEIDDELGRVVVSIIDAESGDVVRKVPSDTVLQVAKMIVQMQGSSINTQA